MAKLFKDKIIKQKLESFQIENFEHKLEIVKKWHVDYHSGTLKTDKEIWRAPDWTRDFLWDILEYTSKPDENYTYEIEPTIAGQRPDFILGHFTSSKWYIIGELKAAKISLDAPQKWHGSITPVQQAFKYKWNVRDSSFVIVSNFFETRLYYDNYLDYEMWNLDTLVNPKNDYYQLKKFIYLLTEKNLIAKRGESQTKWLISFIQMNQKEITKKFYKDYSILRKELFVDIIKNAKENGKPFKQDQLDFVLSKTQKIIDRIIFIHFCEDLGLLPQWKIAETVSYAENMPWLKIWDILKWFFEAVNSGSEKLDIPDGYNGWLFHKDQELEALEVWDDICKKFVNLWDYDFEDDLSVNILGHIFEQSISDIEELKDKIQKNEEVTLSKRKKDGVFYTPEYIVDYIVKNSVWKKIEDWEQELRKKHNLLDTRLWDKKYQHKAIAVYTELQDKLQNITVLDPACGSGAFLVNVFDFLLAKNEEIANTLLDLKWWAKQMGFENTQSHFKSILQNNIYWVDLNDESVEITKLSLWLKTAIKWKQLANLDQNIKCWNSLIDDSEIAWDKAFSWETKFPQIFADWGFDVIVGNPPYVFTRESDFESSTKEYVLDYLENKLVTTNSSWINIQKWKINLFAIFLIKSFELIKKGWNISFIIPNNILRATPYEAVRKYLLDYTNLDEIIDLWKWVFSDAVVSTIIISYSKNNNNQNKINIKKNITDFINLKFDEDTIEQNYFLWNQSCTFNILVNQVEIDLIAKIESNSSKLWEYFDYISPWIDWSKEKFVSEEKINNSYKPLLFWKNFWRYVTSFANKYILYDRKVLNRARDENIFLSDKIIIQRISWWLTPIKANLDNQKFYTFNSVNNLVIKPEHKNLLKIFLVLLNSRLINWYYALKFSNKSELTVNISKTFLEILPIKNIPLSEQTSFIEKANFMLEHNKIMWEKVQKFLSRVQTTFELKKLSKKLQKFYELTFAEFLGELKKKKITLTLKDQDEWEDYFDSYKTEIVAIKTKIDACDKQIDDMVFDLYGLSEEERDVVINS